MTCHQEHIDNKLKRSERLYLSTTGKSQSISSSKLILSVNNKMLSYQVSAEFDFNQESSNSDLSETADVILKVRVKVRCLEESKALDSKPQGPYMIEPLTDDNWITECSREVQEAEQRNPVLQNRFDKYRRSGRLVLSNSKEFISQQASLESIADNFS